MKPFVLNENNKLFFKACYDAVSYSNSIAQTALTNYNDLTDKYNRYVVLNQELSGKQNQLIQISTTFGTSNPSDPNIKEFNFNIGSVLRYQRTLPLTHQDTKEVVNFGTLTNALYNYGTSLTNSLSNYLRNDGGTATGSYVFSKNSANNADQSITFTDLNITSNASITTTNNIQAANGRITNTAGINDSKSIINLEYAQTHFSAPLGAKTQPTFVSGKIAIHENPTQAIIRAKGKYDVISATAPDGTKLLQIKLLKYNTTASWDGTDKSWVQLFGSDPQSSIAGYDLSTASGRIPFPVNFKLYIEYLVNGTDFPFSLINNNSRVRAELTNGSTGNGSYLESSLIIDSDGDLSLIVESDYYFNVPYSASPISLNCSSTDQTLLYLVVDRWSYLPKDDPYIDMVGISNPQLTFTSQSWMRASDSTGTVTKRYRLLYSNITDSITWSSNYDTTLNITYGLDSVGYYADIDFPTGETVYNVTFTATFASTSLQKTVSLQLKNYSYTNISITTSSYSTTRYDLNPATLPISFQVYTSGGEGALSYSIISTDPTLGSTTLGSAAISSTGLVTGNYTTAGIDEYVIVSIHDTTAASPVLAKITITVTENSSGGSGGGGTGDPGWCFSEDTYILTTLGAIKIKDISMSDFPINLNLEKFGYGEYELRFGKIRQITHHKPNVPLVNIHGIDVTVNHPFGLANGLWKEASKITQDDSLVKLIQPDTIIKDAFEGSTNSTYIGEVWNIHLEELNYFVSASESGPWYLVHNVNIETLS